MIFLQPEQCLFAFEIFLFIFHFNAIRESESVSHGWFYPIALFLLLCIILIMYYFIVLNNCFPFSVYQNLKDRILYPSLLDLAGNKYKVERMYEKICIFSLWEQGCLSAP